MEQHSAQDQDDSSASLLEKFETDGFLTLRQVLPTEILHPWRILFDDLWTTVFAALYAYHHIQFPIDERKRKRIDTTGTTETTEYALGLGVKHGFQEIVMRSPGRYEMSLLHHEAIWNNHDVLQGGQHHKAPSFTSSSSLLLAQLQEALTDIVPPLLGQSTWDDVHIANLSFVVSKPGAPIQGWHADGGHLALEKHLPCHCLNVFIPLQNMTTMDWGPTELRPGSHAYTRNLAPMLLAAKCRKQLRPTQAPLLQMGDILLFDYRILHRGLANHRPNNQKRVILVLTVSHKNFRDRLNFPSRSIYDPADKTRIDDALYQNETKASLEQNNENRTYFRPRYLYFAFFCWISTTGGRFLAPFLEHEAKLPTDSIGLVLALQSMVGMTLGSFGGRWADERERHIPGKGRVQVMALGIFGGGLCCLLHALYHLSSIAFFSSPWWHAGLQVMYAACCILTIPVLDGVTIQFLDDHPDLSQEAYGRERLWGAVGWAIVHIAMAPLLDWVGFSVVYPLSIVSTLGTLFTLYLFISQNPSKVTFKRHTSDIVESSKPTTEGVLPWQTICGLLAGTVYGSTFLFALFTLAQGQAVVDNLVFIFFEYLGSSYTMMGFTVLLTVSFEIPIFRVAPSLLQQYGSSVLLLVAALCYIVRAIGYSFIPKGHIAYVLILEPLHGITYACGQTASVDMAAKCMPKGYEATGQSLISVVRGFGSFLGVWLGGWAMDKWGPRLMYRGSSFVVLVGASVFGLALTLATRRLPTARTPIPTQDPDETVSDTVESDVELQHVSV
jgi:predicted MFS family arabinose efflux permease